MSEKTLSFFSKPVTLILSLVYYFFSAVTFIFTFFGLIDIEEISEQADGVVLVKILQYSFSVFLLLCAIVYLLLYISSKRSEKKFRIALIMLKIEASLEIAFDVFLVIIFFILLLVVGFVAITTAFLFLPSIIISGLIITVVSIVLSIIFVANITRNIAKLLFAGAVRKNLNRNKSRGASLFYAIMNFFSAGIAFVAALLFLFLMNGNNGLFFAVFTASLIPPYVLNGFLVTKYCSEKQESVRT